jgi:bud site selection protein 31
MPLPQKWYSKNRKPPPGFEYVEPVLEALENELRDKVKESNLNKRKTESIWPIHQINWQKSRYIYDLFYTHQKISKQVYQYCLDQKIVDAALIAKWKKKGYERLCSTYVINPSNYKFGTTSICRVPWFDRSEEQKKAQDPTVRISSQTIILNTKSNLLSLSRRDAEDVLLGRGLGLEIFLATNTVRIWLLCKSPAKSDSS